MAITLGPLVEALTTATSPSSRKAAADALSAAIADAASRGEDLRTMFENVPGSDIAIPIGPAELTAIGNLQRFLADVATGSIALTPKDASAVIGQFGALLGGGVPGLPGMPSMPAMPIPGFPFPTPPIPGLDPCKLIKCLAASMDCDGASGGGSPPGFLPGVVVEPIDAIKVAVDNGIEILKNARDMAEEGRRQADQLAKDLAAAAKEASGDAKKAINAARKEAESTANDLVEKSEQLGGAIGSALASAF